MRDGCQTAFFLVQLHLKYKKWTVKTHEKLIYFLYIDIPSNSYEYTNNWGIITKWIKFNPILYCTISVWPIDKINLNNKFHQKEQWKGLL